MNSIRPLGSVGFARSGVIRMALLIVLISVGLTQAKALESLFGSGPTPLSPEEAFKPSVDKSTADTINIRFDIADEYYLYEKKFSFESSSNDVTVGQPTFPKALVHEDEYFGKSNIFRNSAVISVPVSATSNKSEFDLIVGYQGCADMGLCYPPTKNTLTVALPALAAADSVAAKTSLAEPVQPIALPKLNIADAGVSQDPVAPGKVNLSDLFKQSTGIASENEAPLLGPQEAFIPSILRATNDEITLRWFIEPGYYLYRDKINFTLINNGINAGDATVSEFDVDRGVMQNDAFFGDVEILREVPGARIKLANAQNITNASLQIQSQGCADIGVCFPPEITTLPVSFTEPTAVVAATISSDTSVSSVAVPVEIANANVETPAQSNAAIASTASSAAVAPALPETEQNKLTRLLEDGNLGFIAFA